MNGVLMIFNTKQQYEMVKVFFEALGRDFINTYDRGHNWTDEELFLLVHFQKRQEFKALGNENQTQQIHDDLKQFVIFQLGNLQVPLSDSNFQKLNHLIHLWLHEMYWYNSDLAVEINSGLITESIADEKLIERYYGELYSKIVSEAFNVAKIDLSSQCYEGSLTLDDVESAKINLSINMLSAKRFST